MANTFLKTIKTITQSLIDKAHYDKTRTGRITGANTVTNTYTILVDGHTYNNVRTVNDFSYAVGDIVKVVIPSNQATQMYISGAALSDESIGKKMGSAESLLDEHSELIAELEEQIDGKIETWAQMTDPANDWTTTALQEAHDGDLWYYTGINSITVGSVTILPSRTYQYDSDSATWVLFNSSDTSLFDFADGKSTVWYGAYNEGTSTSELSPSSGDFFYNTSTGVTYIYSSSAWGVFTAGEDGDYLVDASTGSTYKYDYDNTMWVLVTDYATPINTMTSQIATIVDELGNVYQLYITTVYSTSSVTHKATLTQNGIDITDDTEEIEGETLPLYSNDMIWCSKTLDGYEYLGTGSSVTISKSDLYYGQVISIWWTRRSYAYLLNEDGDTLVNSDGDALVARAEDSLFEEED